MRLLITGASGFIGSAILRQLDRSFFSEVHGIARHRQTQHEAQVTWHATDLFEGPAVDRLFGQVKPTHIIHAAWETTHGTFWTSEKNRDWLSVSQYVLDCFARNGGKRFIFLGSMAEYDWLTMPLVEDGTQHLPFTLYGQTKLAFHRLLMGFTTDSRISAATGRMFNLYGPDEKQERLVPQLMSGLGNSQRIQVGSGGRLRDILHVDDAASAILALLHSELTGAVNIAHGTPTRMDALYKTIGMITGRGDLIGIGERPDTPGEPNHLYADATRIRSTGWRPKIALEDGLRELWTMAQLHRAA